MTDEQREIRNAERRAFAEVRRWRREAKELRESMTPEEHKAYLNKVRAEFGFVLYTPEGYKPGEYNPPGCRPYWRKEKPVAPAEAENASVESQAV
jgi:hypothetical protein